MHPTFVSDDDNVAAADDDRGPDDVLIALKSTNNCVVGDSVVATEKANAAGDGGSSCELEVEELKVTIDKFEAELETDSSERQQWGRQLEFVMSVVGYAVGLGNVWRFPYLCYKNGGGAFLVPYILLLVGAGIPIFLLEVSLGQFMSQGGVGAWNICPLFKGIGVASAVVVVLLNIYYVVVLAWDVYYGYMSLTSVLPWSHCNNEWNTDRCRSDFRAADACDFGNITDSGNLTNFGNITDVANISSSCLFYAANATHNMSKHFVDPVIEFWERKVLEISSGIDEPGGIVGHLALSMLFVWVVCYFCIWKGISWIGKIAYFTATFPYVILTILLIRGVTLDGAIDGIIYYIKPDFTKLLSSEVWIDAGTQIFFSFGIALGCMTALGSYNKFHTNTYKNCIVIACVNSATSLYAGFAIFSVIGFMANEQGLPVSEVAESGPGLIFIAYPKAFTQLPLAPLWAVLFFFMVFLLGLGSQFTILEGLMTVFSDISSVFRRYREICIAVYCCISYLISLSLVTRGGMYVFQLCDYYAASGMALLWICFFQTTVVGWLYGAGRFYDNMEQMLGYRIGCWMRICWSAITPFITAGIFIFMWVQYVPIKYNRTYEYPDWAIAFGMCMGFASMICIPIYAIIRLLREKGTLKQRWTTLTTPVLLAQRIPAHWPDAERLKAVAK